MILAAADTNTLASGFLNGRASSPPREIVRGGLTGRFRLVVSEPILDEVARTFRKPYFAQRFTERQQAANLAQLRTHALVTPLTVDVSGAATHPEDDIVLATAISGGAQFLVTGDYKFLSLRRYEGVLLVTAREFLAMLPGLMSPPA